MKLIKNIVKKIPQIKRLITERDSYRDQVQKFKKETEELHAIILNKEQELQSKSKEYEAKISHTSRIMEQQNEMQIILNRAITEREEKIDFLYKELEQQRNKIQENLNRAIAEREEKIDFLYKELEQQRNKIQENLNRAIAEREEKISALYQEIEKQKKLILNISINKNNFNSAAFWEEHYKKGGDSGAGSRDHLSEFKAKIVNNFIKNNNINTLIEIGCGDGNIISMLNVNNYVGVDVSPTIIEKNRKLFQHDMSKSFFTTEEREEYIYRRFDASLSMDVIFHLVEDDIFYAYMKDLFDLSERYVIIYSSNHEEYTAWKEFRHRNFTGYVQNNFPEWEIYKYIPNKYPYIIGNETGTSVSDFFIYRKKTYKRERKYL